MQERNELMSLFQKYQDGLVNEEEKNTIAQWLVQLELSGESLNAAQLNAKEELSRKQLKDFFFPDQSPKPKVARLSPWLKSVAASLFIAIALGTMFYVRQQNKDQADQVFLRQSTTQTGEMKVVTLSDGSKITLNNQSSLKYPSSFKGKTREVYLVGQAFFEVAHDPEKPFKVHTDQLDVQVLGTSFDIFAYPKDEKIAVAVATGKVGVLSNNGKKTNTHFLLPGDKLTYDRLTSNFNSTKVNIADIFAWNGGKLTFRNETLESITTQLQRYYKVKFVFNNRALRYKKISLKVNKQHIATVMNAISISGDFHYKMAGDTITLW